jgi:hypothetical protein
MAHVTQAEFARLKGVSRKTVTVWKDQGRLTMNGNLVDVEASQAELLRSASGASLGKRSRVTRVTSRSKLTSEVTGDVKAEVTPPRLRRPLFEGVAGGEVAILYLVSDESAASLAAELLLPRLPEQEVRAIVAQMYRRLTLASATCLDMDFPPPPGHESWETHPAFNAEPLTEGEWAELKAESAAAA